MTTSEIVAAIDIVSRAIQELDDLTHHQPDGTAMKAQEALLRLACDLAARRSAL